MRSTTDDLILAMRILGRETQSADGVANACMFECADRLEEAQRIIERVIGDAAYSGFGETLQAACEMFVQGKSNDGQQ